MVPCLFASDLHGRVGQYEALWGAILEEKPAGVLLGGDLLPSGPASVVSGKDYFGDFLSEYFVPRFKDLQSTMGPDYPDVFLILGNDDPRIEEEVFQEMAYRGLWHYAHNSQVSFRGFRIFGYSYVPPTPFHLKDWERYDVSRYIPPGSTSPEEGGRTVEVSPQEAKYSTIKEDLEVLAGEDTLDDAVFLFHTPPHETALDRAALDGKSVDYVPLDLHVGSIAVRRFIEERQPMVTLHGHIHESPRLTGSWKDRLGRTHLFSAAHDGPELALVRIDLEYPEQATRTLL
ncbi:metallophosphoesterase [Gemmatimonadota bacterium]